MKRCFKCKATKPLAEFYKHEAMNDGKLGKCKECTKSDVRANRLAKLEYYREFDRMRASAPHRVAARREYIQTADGKRAHARANRKWMEQHPNRRKASYIVGNAIRDGKLQPHPCHICGTKAQAHHPDYSAPLDVVWLCAKHHRQAHDLVRKAA